MAQLPYIELDDLMVLLGYKNRRAIRDARDRGTLPVPLYRIGKRLVADREVVAEYFRKYRREGLADLEEMHESSRTLDIGPTGNGGQGGDEGRPERGTVDGEDSEGVQRDLQRQPGGDGYLD